MAFTKKAHIFQACVSMWQIILLKHYTTPVNVEMSITPVRRRTFSIRIAQQRHHNVIINLSIDLCGVQE